MIERFDGSARTALANAARQTSAFGHTRMGTEHLLLGLLQQDDGEISRVLRGIGVSTQQCREAVLSAIDRSEPLRSEYPPPLTAEAQRAVEQAPNEAFALGFETARAEHLLLALLRHRDALSARLLQRLGVEYVIVRQELTKQPATSPALISPPLVAPSPSPPPSPSMGSGLSPDAQAAAHELDVELALRLAKRLASLSRVITLEVCERDDSTQGIRVSCEPKPGEGVLRELFCLEDDGFSVILDSGGVARFAAL